MKPRISPVTLQQPLLETISGSEQGGQIGWGDKKSLRDLDFELDEYDEMNDYAY